MNLGLGLLETEVEVADSPVSAPTFLIEVQPWYKVFLSNLAAQFRKPKQPSLQLVSAPGKFWPDVFVASPLPWARFLESMCYHVAVIAAILTFFHYLPQPTEIVDRPAFSKDDVVYYSKSEYLPPIDTGGPKLRSPRKGEPELAKQPILSVPPDADNHTQTIVAPPQIKLNHEVQLPNFVAAMPVQGTVPMAATAHSMAEMNRPTLPSTVVAPSPVIDAADTRRQHVRAPQAAVVEPAPDVNAVSARRLADINIAHSNVVAPAPQLALSERRAVRSVPLGNAGAKVVPPPPSMAGNASSNSGQQMIALGIHPVQPGAPVQAPTGNRRGTFAANLEGKAGAPGTPESPTGKSQAAAGANHGSKGVPSGLVVGAAPKSADASGNSGLIANATPPRVSSTPGDSTSQTNSKATEIEKQVFGDKKFYSMTLNLPNLNSRGGSWVVHFAELAKNDLKGDLTAPVATKEVDPGYPTELMRRNVQGTVTLYAIIHNDGSVGEVRVLRGVDDRLDEYACAALAHWRFLPATKNGFPVDLEAVVVIPFHPIRVKGNF
jgi:TonB family protein